MPEAREADELLVARARRGDRAAFGQLVERYQDGLFNGISRMVSQREDAEDLAQEVFLKAFSGIGGFEGRSSFFTWLYSIAVNVVISHRRKLGSRVSVGPVSVHERADEDGRPPDPADPSDGPDRLTEQRELHARLEEAIEQLDDEYRMVVVLRDIEGFDYETIARLVGCPPGTVKSRLHRARLALREQLKDLGA